MFMTIQSFHPLSEVVLVSLLLVSLLFPHRFLNQSPMILVFWAMVSAVLEVS